MMTERELQLIIDRCRSEIELDGQVELLRQINRNLPPSIQIVIPSLLTNDFVFWALDLIEERMMISLRSQEIQSGCI
jgi:hypothetical protein